MQAGRRQIGQTIRKRKQRPSSKRKDDEYAAHRPRVPRSCYPSWSWRDFEPKIVRKHLFEFKGVDDKILSMYARGMKILEISGHLKEIYNVDVSSELMDPLPAPSKNSSMIGASERSICSIQFHFWRPGYSTSIWTLSLSRIRTIWP